MLWLPTVPMSGMRMPGCVQYDGPNHELTSTPVWLRSPYCVCEVPGWVLSPVWTTKRAPLDAIRLITFAWFTFREPSSTPLLVVSPVSPSTAKVNGAVEDAE